jgi:hypothetical protein
MKRLWLAVIVIVAATKAAAQIAVPPYIQAKPDHVTKAFGPAVSAKIFSDAFTPVRRDTVLRSTKRIPGFECPDDPPIMLGEITPYPIKPGAISWVERYLLACKPATQRNFLTILEDDQARMIELLPGTTAADPQLQRDAFAGSSAAIGTRPPGCDKQWITDTRVTSAYNGRDPWTERWSYDVCGAKAEVDMTFTPSKGAGTNWGAKLVK